MSNFMDFLTGGIQSAFSPEPSAPSPEPSQPRASSSPFSDLFASTEQQYGLPPGYLERTARVESSFNPNAKNPNSSAGGLFQFIDGTARQYGLADRYDPVQATDAAARLARDNAAILKRTLGRDPTAGELYLAHQQGAGGAVKLLSNPDAPAEAIVGSAAARLNGGAGLTAGQLAQKWTAKIDGGQPSQGGNPALAYAATRGRDPRASMPAPDATQAMGQMQMPSRQMPPDLSNSPDGGARDFMLRQAGIAPDMQPSGPQGGGGAQSLVQMLMGAVGGGGGSGQQQMRQPDSIEALIPDNKPNPFAFMGEALMENQQAAQKRQGQIFEAKQLVAQGMSPQDAVAAVFSSGTGKQLALGGLQQQKALREQEALRQRLDSGQGGVAAPAPVQAGGEPMPSQPTQAGEAAAQPGGENKAGGFNVQNKTIPYLLSERDKKIAEIRKLAEIPTSPATEGMVKSRIDAKKLELGNVDEKLKVYAQTSDQREYVDQMRQRQEMGQPTIPMEQWDINRKKAGAANVSVKNEGSIPPGYQIERDAQGNPLRMVAIPGGPADTEAKQKAEKEKLGREQTKASATVVIDALDDIDRLMKTAKLPTTGAIGVRLSEIGGTAASDIASTLKTIRANISFDKLSEMRAASATGAALGAVSDTEMALLANSAAALEQSQSEAQFKTNLKRLRERFNTVINGPRAGGGEDKQTGKTGGPVKAFTRADYDKLEAGSEYQDAEGNIRRKGGK